MKKAILIISMLIIALFLTACSKQDPAVLNSFATCLTEKGAKMYGAYWCGHCKNQKKLFGSSFAKVEYVECTEETQRRTDEGIKGYPTWKLADGSSLNGVQTLASLAQKTGCLLS